MGRGWAPSGTHRSACALVVWPEREVGDELAGGLVAQMPVATLLSLAFEHAIDELGSAVLVMPGPLLEVPKLELAAEATLSTRITRYFRTSNHLISPCEMLNTLLNSAEHSAEQPYPGRTHHGFAHIPPSH